MDQGRPEVLPSDWVALEAAGAELVLGPHPSEPLATAEWIVANPAVRPDLPALVAARARGAIVTSEVELVLGALAGRVAAVTGTQGKSSTTTFAVQLLRAAGLPALAGGNLGGSLLDRLDSFGPDQRFVLELSSYQLEALSSPLRSPPRLEAAALLNVLPDHLERHGSFQEYARAKGRLFELLAPGGLAVLGPGLPAPALEVLAGDHHRLELPCEGPDAGPLEVGGVPLWPAEELPLPAFQRGNVRAALALAHALGATAEALAGALPTLRAPAHRLESLGSVAGRPVWDNGVSTTPDSTLAALAELPAPVTVLLGGQPKAGLDYGLLARTIAERGDLAIVFGAAVEPLGQALASAGARWLSAPALDAATALAMDTGSDALLFSPACASFDAFPNFRERALSFRRLLGLPTPSVETRADPRE
jgi:UDP-N-acetylmuramoylalanine--D-glutamate ligase